MRTLSGFLMAVLISGCAMFGSVSDSIGGAYVSIETLADTIQMECGNVVPGGPCRATSMLDRGDVDSMKVDLQRAKDTVDEANRIYNTGNVEGAMSKLEVTQAILASLRTALEIRGVE